MQTEIHSATQLQEWLSTVTTLDGARLQNVDLTGDAGRDLLAHPGSMAGLVVLGGRVPADVVQELMTRGAIVFPTVTDTPIDPYRNHLYSAEELYAGLDVGGYAATPDAAAYRWSRDSRLSADAYTTALRALHDDAVRDSLHETLADRCAVGVMGGHAWSRDDSRYADVARASKRLADAGLVVLTGGGPGAMEAANLGACARVDALDEAIGIVRRVPSFTDVGAWASSGLAARRLLTDTADAGPVRSVGIPTWFYGHEPPNVFADVIAKYFSNALREDDLLAGSRTALIVLPGAAGTVQEIFQAVTPLYYAPEGAPLPRVVLVGHRQWRQEVPVWAALQALAAGRGFAACLHLVDTAAEAVDLVIDGVG